LGSDTRKRWKPTLRLTIGAIMCALVAAMAVLVFTLLYSGARKSLLTFSDALMREVASTARAQVRGFLNVGRIAIEQAGGLAQNRGLDPGDVESFEAFSCAFLETQLTVNALYYGDENGDMTMVQRRPDGSFSTKIVRRTRSDDKGEWTVQTTWRHRDPGAPLDHFRTIEDPDDRYDPRERGWYRHWSEMSPQERPASRPRPDRGPGSAFWTDVYVFHTTREPGATASLPYIDRDGKFRGVIGVDLALADLSRFLSTVQVGRSGMAFIMDGRRRLIAVPDYDRLLYDAEHAESGAEPELRTIEHSFYPEIRALANDPAFDGRAGGREVGAFVFHHAGKRHLATLAAVAPETGSDLVIGVVAPEDDFLGQIKRTRAVTAACIAGAMILALVLAALVSRLVSRHLMKLAEESSRIRDLEIAPSQDPGSMFKEIHDVLSAFEGMKTGLRSFEKYVPSKLVRRLLARRVEPVYGGSARELTVLFSDIRNFTPLCETMDPGIVSTKLGAYFSAITDAVQDEQSQSSAAPIRTSTISTRASESTPAPRSWGTSGPTSASTTPASATASTSPPGSKRPTSSTAHTSSSATTPAATSAMNSKCESSTSLPSRERPRASPSSSSWDKRTPSATTSSPPPASTNKHSTPILTGGGTWPPRPSPAPSKRVPTISPPA